MASQVTTGEAVAVFVVVVEFSLPRRQQGYAEPSRGFVSVYLILVTSLPAGREQGERPGGLAEAERWLALEAVTAL